MTDQIPITFELSGEAVAGWLTRSRPEENIWHLNVKRQSKIVRLSSIFLFPNDEWVFSWNGGGLETQEDHFEQVIIA